MIVDETKFLLRLIDREFLTAHLDQKIFRKIVRIDDKLPADVKKGVTAAKDAQYLKDSDWLFLFANKDDLTPDEDSDREEEELAEDEVDTSQATQVKIKVAKALEKIFPLAEGEKVELFDVEIKKMKMFAGKISFK